MDKEGIYVSYIPVRIQLHSGGLLELKGWISFQVKALEAIQFANAYSVVICEAAL